VRDFFAFVRERYSILLRRRSGQPGPWTHDPVLAKYRFCNVFREDDKTTMWFREHVREPLAQAADMRVLMATVIFRWFNRIATGKVLLEYNLFADWNASRARDVLKDLHPLITGAYVIRTPAGMNKLEGLISLISPMWDDRQKLYSEINGQTLENSCVVLQNRPGLGSFMAYEIVTDLRHTQLLSGASDVMSWANPGPGAARGLGLVLFGDAEEFSYSAQQDGEKLQRGMRHLLALAQGSEYWPAQWPSWEMREVEHSLCEFAKYCGAKEGRKLKQRFDQGPRG